MKLAVLGAGAWGTAISISLVQRHRVVLWARDAQQAREIAATRANQRYFPGFTIPDAIAVTVELAAALEACDVILVATATADRKSTRLNSSHANISYAVFC